MNRQAPSTPAAMLSVPGYRLGRPATGTADNMLFAAVREKDGEPVTIKLCSLKQEEQRASLEREYGLLSRCKSPRVVRPRKLIRSKEHLAMVLDPFPTQHLDLFVDGRPLPIGTFLNLAIQLAETLAEIHAERIIHRNIYPGVVFVDEQKTQIKLAGFDHADMAAIERHRDHETNLLPAGLPYISPERTGRTSRRSDVRSDLYSLGAMFYLMLTGKPPFRSADPLELIHLHLAVIPLSPQDLVADIPASISNIVVKLLEKDPGQRYQTAKGLMTDLRHCQMLLANTAGIPAFELGHEDLSDTLLFPEKLYGRENELEKIRDACARCRGGRTEILLVSGPAGMGKTALVTRLQELESANGLVVLSGKFDQYHRNVPYGAFVRAFSMWANQALTGSEERVTAWRTAINGALGSLAAVIVDLIPQLEWIVGNQPSPRSLGPAESQNRLHLAVLRFVGAIATTDSPVVLFLDDLHWADHGSLRLLESLVSLGDRAALLIIGALRDDAATDNAHFQALYLQWKEHTGCGSHLRLKPLAQSHVNRMIADLFDKVPTETRELANLVGNITENNPLFIRQFLSLLKQRDLIQFHPSRGWDWNTQSIRRTGLPKDIDGIIAEKIQALPDHARDVLRWAACIGQYFEMPTIATLGGMPESDVSVHLNTLIVEGFLEPAGPNFQFTHDRIYDQAIDLTPPRERALFHRQIGQYHLNEMADQQRSPHFFDLVDNFNLGKEVLNGEAERIQLAELNLQAGKKAMDTAAYGTAFHYLQIGRDLLKANDWEDHRELVYGMWLREAQVRFLLDDHRAATTLLNDLYARDLDFEERARLAARHIELYNLRTDWQRAIDLGLAELARLGVRFQRNPSRWRLRWRLLKVHMALLGKSDKDLLNLPRAKEDRFLAITRILIEIAIPAYFGDIRLVNTIVMYMMEGLLKHGHHRYSAVVFAMYGTLMGVVTGQTIDRERFGKLALNLNDTIGHPRFRQRTTFMVHYLLFAWMRPYKQVIQALRDNIRDDLAAGDIQYAGFAYQDLNALMFMTGMSLKRLDRECQESLIQLRQLGYLELMAISERMKRITHFLLQNQPELLAHFDPQDDPFDLIPLRQHSYQTFYYFCIPHVAAVYYLMEEYQSAFDLTAAAEPIIARVVSGGQQIPENTFYFGLSAGALLDDAEGETRRGLLEALRRALDKYHGWHEIGRCNFHHKFLFLQAEMARAKDDIAQAGLIYTQAREQAMTDGFPNITAMIDERRGTLALSQEWMREAVYNIREAILGYTTWGAMAKVCLLWQRYADYIQVTDVPESHFGEHRRQESGSNNLSKEELDLGTIIQNALGISQEVERDKVSDRVLSSAMEHVGAQRGVLVLSYRGQLCLAAETQVHRSFHEHRPPTPLESAVNVPITAINFVQRTMETVILPDAASKGLFKNDPFIRQHRIRSILIVPIVKRSRLVGMLYLENNLIDNAFSENALPVLRVIAAQAAIALENARLYDELSDLNRDLECRVEARTQELRQANRRLTNEIDYRRKAQRELEELQGQLLETARRAGMAEMATGVLHNVGNVLNSVTISATNIAEKLKNTKLPRLGGLVELLNDHTDNLADFLVHDSRGHLIPKFLDELNRNLTKNHAALKEEIRNLSNHLTHAIHVIQIQQDHARLKAVLEPITPEELVSQALKICGAKFKNQGIALYSEFENLPSFLVDRHKVLQILVNLIDNAIQALDDQSDPAPSITIGIRKLGRQRMMFTVEDNGKGISKENLTRIFSYGFTTRNTGHGFGLHNAANAATELNGSLRVDSEGTGRGAIFYLELPFKEEVPRSF